MILVKGMPCDKGFKEGAVDVVSSFHGAQNQGADAELIDGAGSALGDMENAFDGFIGKEIRVGIDALEVEADVAEGVFKAEGF